MTSLDRRAREQTAVREKILSAARELFVHHGYEAVSLRKIAESIEYSAPALYTHFADKDEILVELCRRDFASLAEHFHKIGRVADPVARVFQIGRAYIRFAHEYPNQYRLMFMTPDLRRVEPRQEDLDHKGNPDHDAFAFLRQAVSEAMDRGAFRSEHKDAELLAQVLWSGVHGVASLQVSHGECPWMDWRSLERRSRTMCEALLRGLLSERGNREFNP
jgi:AcrR family transcriptional regulator